MSENPAKQQPDVQEKNTVKDSTAVADLGGARNFTMDDLKAAVGSNDRISGGAAAVLDQTNIQLVGGKDAAASQGDKLSDGGKTIAAGAAKLADQFTDGAKVIAGGAATQGDKVSDDAKTAAGGGVKGADNTGKVQTDDSKKVINQGDKINPDVVREMSGFKGGESLQDLAEKFKAAEKMNEKIPPTMSEQDRQTAKDLNWALASGNPDAAAKAIERFKGKPEELKKFMDEYNKTLKDSGSGVRATVDGESVTFNNSGDKGVQISTDGRATVRDIKHYPNGLVVNGGQDTSSAPSDVMKKMGEDTRTNISFHEWFDKKFPKDGPREFPPIHPSPKFPSLEPNPFPHPIDKGYQN